MWLEAVVRSQPTAETGHGIVPKILHRRRRQGGVWGEARACRQGKETLGAQEGKRRWDLVPLPVRHGGGAAVGSHMFGAHISGGTGLHEAIGCLKVTTGL